MPILSESCSISDKRWLEIIIVTPYSSGRERIRERISCIPAGSRPFVGSSKSKSRGFPKRALAMPRRCFIPNE